MEDQVREKSVFLAFSADQVTSGRMKEINDFLHLRVHACVMYTCVSEPQCADGFYRIFVDEIDFIRTQILLWHEFHLRPIFSEIRNFNAITQIIYMGEQNEFIEANQLFGTAVYVVSEPVARIVS
jgi:hypothetical protein